MLKLINVRKDIKNINLHLLGDHVTCARIEVLMMMMMKNCYCGMVALFSAGTIVRDPHHRESLTRREQDLNLHRT